MAKLKVGKRHARQRQATFCACRTVEQLESLLRLPRHKLMLHAQNPVYYKFKVPKKDGSFREIEAPDPELKRVQRKLNEYLQIIYSRLKPKISFGFIQGVRQEKDPRSIVTNAQQHCGSSYLLNVDVEDFFHQVCQAEVIRIFMHPPFSFNKRMARTLASICTLDGRLPMGAPTSPVLSNFACRPLDQALFEWADENEMNITRFVDDISLSAKKRPIHLGHFSRLNEICDKYSFFLNPDKTKYYGPSDIKLVTGLVVSDRVSIPDEYFSDLETDLERLKSVAEVDIITGRLPGYDMVKKYKQEVMGKINFISIVHGRQNDVYHNYLDKFDMANNPPDGQLSARWMNFNYLR